MTLEEAKAVLSDPNNISINKEILREAMEVIKASIFTIPS